MNKTRSKKPIKWVPFDPKGNVDVENRTNTDRLDDPGFRYQETLNKWNPVEWRPNSEFTAELTFSHVHRFTMSDLEMIYKDDNGVEYPIFFDEFLEMLQDGTVQGKKISGKWTFTKWRQYYAITRVK